MCFLAVFITFLSLSWDSRRGDTPRAGAPHKYWGRLRRWQVLLRNFPVQRSRLKCRWWRYCWNCPAETQKILILASLRALPCVQTKAGAQTSMGEALLAFHCFKITACLLYHHYSKLLATSQWPSCLCFQSSDHNSSNCFLSGAGLSL